MWEKEENEVDKTTTKKDIEQRMYGDERKKPKMNQQMQSNKKDSTENVQTWLLQTLISRNIRTLKHWILHIHRNNANLKRTINSQYE